MRGRDNVEAGNWQEREAQKLAQSIIKHANLKLGRNPEVVARAIYMINEDLPERIMAQWVDGVSSEEVEELAI